MKRLIKITAFVLAFMLVCTQVPTVAQAKVTKSEKQKIEKFLKKNCEWYLGEWCLLGGGTEGKFTFNNKRKTDMAIHNLSIPFDKMVNRSEAGLDEFESYSEYVYRYDTYTKKKIKKKGKQLFGSDFKMSLAKTGSESRGYYPLTNNKKYILCNFPDAGDYGCDFHYTSISKKNGIYTVKVKAMSGCYDDDIDKMVYDQTDYFTFKLKKSGNSYIIRSIKSIK